MSYVGSIIIVDDEGDAVFERELSADEIVETLLAAIPDEEAEEQERTPPAGAQSATTGKRKCGNCGKPGHTVRTCPGFEGSVTAPISDDDVRHPCCGSKGHRHKAGCVNGKTTADPQRRRRVANRMPFSQPTFDIVKDMLDMHGRGVDEISSDKGLDLDEVRRINLADDYSDYLTIA